MRFECFNVNIYIFYNYRYTFVDLAQIVCRLPETYLAVDLSSDDDFFDGYASEPSTLHTVSLI